MPSRTSMEVLKSHHNQNQLAAIYLVLIMLSTDWLNPIKAISSALGIPSRWLAYPAILSLGHLIVTHYQEIIYDGVQIFFRSILSIFFRQVDIVGLDNIPKHGPIIYSGNHSNQFVDGLMVMTTAQHRVGFLIAEKSYNHPVVGTLAKLARAVPVKRAQDSAKLKPGTITIEGKTVQGYGGTTFKKSFRTGDKVRIVGRAEQYKVAQIVSDTEIILSEPVPAAEEVVGAPGLAYEGLERVDQSLVFAKVFDSLKVGNCIGIFPEGGSHDRTDLLPLKVGIAIIAFGMLDKYNITVPIVPVGMNYFRGHRFRGRAVVEFGPPILIPEELGEMAKTNKKEAFSRFLTMVEEGMRATLVTAPDYHALHLVYTARRLFQRDNWIPTPQEKMDMNRRFAEGYKVLMAKYGDKKPPEMADLERRIMDYQVTLRELGLRDYQVPTLEQDDMWKLVYTICHSLIVFAVAMFPSVVLNAPVGLIASVISAKEQKKALAASRVKIEAKDVVLSKKITLSIVLVPTLWITYAVLLLAFSNLRPATVAVLFLCCPLFSYVGVMATEAGMIDFKDLKPIVMRLRRKNRQRMKTLPAERAQLQRELRGFIRQVGPDLGGLYTDKELKWDEYIRRTASGTDLQKLINDAVGGHSRNNSATNLSDANRTPGSSRATTPVSDMLKGKNPEELFGKEKDV